MYPGYSVILWYWLDTQNNNVSHITSKGVWTQVVFVTRQGNPDLGHPFRLE